jgi:hypothetical protein
MPDKDVPVNLKASRHEATTSEMVIFDAPALRLERVRR